MDMRDDGRPAGVGVKERKDEGGPRGVRVPPVDVREKLGVRDGLGTDAPENVALGRGLLGVDMACSLRRSP
jgi:hypothetical protein